MRSNYVETVSVTTLGDKLRLCVNRRVVYEVDRDKLIADPGQMLCEIATAIADLVRARSYLPRRAKYQDTVPEGVEGVLRTTDGRDIVGTLEFLKGSAEVTGGVRQQDGRIAPKFGQAGTSIWWDDAPTARCMGGLLFVDDEGNTYGADEIVIEPA